MPFGSRQIVRNSVTYFRGHLYEAFAQGSQSEGLWTAMRQIPGTQTGVCKSLCMYWVAHHASDDSTPFSQYARQFGNPGAGRRAAGNFTGAGIALNQVNYGNFIAAATSAAAYEQLKDTYTDTFLERWGVIRQKCPHDGSILGGAQTRHLLVGPRRFGQMLASAIVGHHSAGYWSYKIVSLHGRAGGHAVCAFVGADAMFFDPNYGIFYFDNKDNFKFWIEQPGGFYDLSGYYQELGDDFVIKSYAPKA